MKKFFAVFIPVIVLIVGMTLQCQTRLDPDQVDLGGALTGVIYVGRAQGIVMRSNPIPVVPPVNPPGIGPVFLLFVDGRTPNGNPPTNHLSLMDGAGNVTDLMPNSPPLTALPQPRKPIHP